MSQPESLKKPSLASKLGDGALTLAAIGGVLCISLVVLAAVFHITLIMFKTGSMSPTIPAGSLAMVREIPASEVAVGDIVTVDRPGALPVTHRVTAVAAAEGEARTLTLRGDANPVEDPAPYTVTTVRTVIWSVPELAKVVVAVSNPLVLGGVTVAASALVTWAFWPRQPASRRSARHSFAAPAAVLIIIGCAGASLAAPASVARAEEVDTLITGDVMRLMAVADGVELANLVPGERVEWQVGVWAREGATGDIELTLIASGALASDPNGLQVKVSVCEQRWVDGACATGGRVVTGPGPASVILDTPHDTLTMDAASQRWIKVDVWLPSNITALPTTTATLRLVAFGSGEALATDTGDLARTGTDSILPLSLAGIAIAGGLLIAWGARVFRDRKEES